MRCRALLLLALLAGAASAQQKFVGERPPEVFDDGPLDRWVTPTELAGSPFARQRFADRYQEQILAGQVAEVAEQMVEDLRNSPWEAEHAPVKAKILKQLDLFLIELRAATHEPGIEGPLDTLAEQALFLARLNRDGRGLDTLRLMIDTDDRPVYFKRRSQDPADWLHLYADGGTTADGETIYVLPLPEKWMREWRLLENALTDLVQEQIKLVRAANVDTLERAVANWEKYLDRGYSMYPWESLLNGWVLDLPPQGPPDRQWILCHPALGVEASAHALDDVRVKEAAVIELAGHLWYTDDFDDYWGVSVTTSLREDLDPGLGVLVHLRRNWNLGVSWHGVDEDPFVFFSVDLFRFASSELGSLHARYEAERAKLGGP